MKRIWRLPVDTTIGEFTALFSDRGLVGIGFPQRTAARRPGDAIPDSLKETLAAWTSATRTGLQEVLAARHPTRQPPFDLAGGTEFQLAVWRTLLTIPVGSTMTYGEVARGLGRPKSARAVGGACGANPIPLLIPCHRVLAANCRLGGFSGGLEWKKRLLNIEGIKVGESDPLPERREPAGHRQR
jgi:O-6-methylguanine DNA methyltransferase